MTDLNSLSVKSNNPTNWLLVYHQQIQDGSIRAGKKIRRIYERLADDIINPKGDWVFDINKADHALRFIENYCKHSKGKMGGKPLLLDIWQKAAVFAMFGFVDAITDLRKYDETLLVVGRKNGKSTFAAAIGLYLMLADGEPGAECYVAATKRDQAKIIWLEAKRMFHKMCAASRSWHRRAKALVGEIVGVGDYEGCSFRPLGADSERLDGLNVHGALMDEIHAWPAGSGTDLYNVIVDGRDAREQPMTLIITTAGFVRDGLYDDKYHYAENWLNDVEGFDDPGFLPIIYELDSKDEVWDPECWIKANPGLDTIKDRSKLARKVEKARVERKALGNLLTKDFNVRASGTETWLDFESIVNEIVVDMDFLRNSYAIGGCDLSATTDLTCATLLIRKPDDSNFYVLQRYFIPESKLEAVDIGDAHNRRSEAPYRLWEEQDWLTVCPGAKIDYSEVTAWFLRMVQEYNIRPLWVCYDAALSGYWVPDMEEHGFDMQSIRQGPFTWTYPMKEMGGTFEEHRVIYQNNPILRWCLHNTGKKSTNKDGVESIQPVKLGEARRIDGTVSLLNAWVGYGKFGEEYARYIK